MRPRFKKFTPHCAHHGDVSLARYYLLIQANTGHIENDVGCDLGI